MVILQTKTVMAASCDMMCDICDVRHETKNAEYWCPECEEGLCLTCQEYHNISKASRHHQVILIENYNKLPKSMTEIVTYCPEHTLKFQNFCPHHEQLCCPVCISTSHRKCIDLLAIPELIKTSKTSTLLDSMEHSLRDTENNLRKVIQDREQNLRIIQDQRQKVYDEIKVVRAQINSHLDFLERKVIEKLNTAELEVTSLIENLLEKLSQESNTVVDLHSTISATKQYASDIQIFLGSKTIESDVEKEDKFVRSLSEDGSLQNMSLRYTVDDKISNILTQITSFGSISIETSPTLDLPKLEKDKQAQIMQQHTPRLISDFNLILQSTFSIPKLMKPPNINGCVICADGKMIFTDRNNNKLVILNDDGTLVKEITCFPYTPNGVTIIDYRTVAISQSRGIQIINIDTKQTERTIKARSRCHGVIHENGKLLWCEKSHGINMIQLPDDTVTTVVKQDYLPDCSYIATNSHMIYQTNCRDKTVKCYTMKGEEMWEYNEGLGNPVGVTLDNDSNVYVISQNGSSVFVISPDGKQGRQLLSSDDGIKKPHGIYFDKFKMNLLVVNFFGTAFLYHLR